MNDVKPFWKSKTIVFAFIGLVAILVDFFFGWGIEPQITNGIDKVFSSEGGQLTGVNWLALFSLIYAIYMRIISVGKVTGTAAKAQAENVNSVNKIVSDMKKRVLMVEPNLRVPILKDMLATHMREDEKLAEAREASRNLKKGAKDPQNKNGKYGFDR